MLRTALSCSPQVKGGARIAAFPQQVGRGCGWGAPGSPPTPARHQPRPSGNVPLLISPVTALLGVLHHFRSKTDCSAANATLLSDPQGEKCFRSFSEQLSGSER